MLSQVRMVVRRKELFIGRVRKELVIFYILTCGGSRMGLPMFSELIKLNIYKMYILCIYIMFQELGLLKKNEDSSPCYSLVFCIRL